MAELTGFSEFQADTGSVNFQVGNDKARKTNDGSCRGVTVVLAVTAIVALAALVLAILTVTRAQPEFVINTSIGNRTNINSPSASDANAGVSVSFRTPDDEDRIWIFAVGHSGKSLEYVDETGGLRGFHIDIVNAVCMVANKNCRTMFIPYINCWDSQAGHWPRIGVGLADRWFDACTGWFVTYDRLRTVDFTHAFRKGPYAYFYVKVGNPGNFNWRNITGKKIAIGDGWASDEYCIKRNDDKITGIVLTGDQFVHYLTADDAEQAVLNGEVDAAFMNTNQFSDTSLIPVSDEITNCMKDGGAMMFRKDTRLSNWWNPAFDRLKESSQYRQICETANRNHGHMPGEIRCVD